MWNDTGYNDPPPLPEQRGKFEERKPAETGWCLAFLLLLGTVAYGLWTMHETLVRIM